MEQSYFEEFLREKIGLDPATIGVKAIERAIRLRMDHCGSSSTQDYWDRINDGGDELQELIEALIVPETSFFREPEAFRALGHFVVEEWSPAHSGDILHILSAPCSSGEEPYSIVMTLVDAGFPAERLRVDAVDISLRALAHGEEATYGANSFRGTDLSYRDRYFEKDSRGYALSPLIRGRVEFRHGNLLRSQYHFSRHLYDVIFFRNLLIYLDRGIQDLVLESLGRILTPEGLLFVGPAEAFLATARGFKAINRSLTFAFRKSTLRTEVSPELQYPHVHRKPKPRAGPVSRTHSRTIRVAPPVTVPSSLPDESLATARSLADSGKLVEAAAACEAHIVRHGGSAQAYCLLGLIHDANGNQRFAEEGYRKALYLDPGHGEALTHLALLSERLGDLERARRLRERAAGGSMSPKE
jgi:chemotaxis protein methyltransferase WspC